MGCSSSAGEGYADEEPGHAVTFTKGFWIGETEVIVSAYRALVEATVFRMAVAPAFDTEATN